ncbi:MAG TPA: hypothetical protein VKB33_05535 [Nitrospira sp.]|nr:hypothetical protein [Nitrospira sp.]
MYNVTMSVIGAITLAFALTHHAAAEGLPDVLGIQLGMPAREAYAKLQGALPKNKVEVRSINLPTIEKPVILSFSSGSHNVAMGTEGDEVIVDVTLPPNKQEVWRVSRLHFFPDKGIPRATLLASLREKYGKETRVRYASPITPQDENHISSLLWLMNEQGRPAQRPPLNGITDPIDTCNGGRGEAAHYVETPMPNYGNKDLAWCMSSYTAVLAEFQDSALPELYTQLSVIAVSLPFAGRAGEATMKWKNEIAEGQHRQDIDKAKQQEKPKL